MATANFPDELLSLGYLASLVGMSPGQIANRLDQRGVRPTTRINGIAHYSTEAVKVLQEGKQPRPTKTM